MRASRAKYRASLRLAPAVQLVERVEAALEIGEQRNRRRLLSFTLLDNRAQELGRRKIR